ncbi:MAG: hypothetical protein LBD42_09110, partial [Desulfovibrio sp.]|nr:hypothetical protein [Desulfovibrio sp.]
SRDIFEGYRSQGPRRLLKAPPKPTLLGYYKMCEKFWTLPYDCNIPEFIIIFGVYYSHMYIL